MWRKVPLPLPVICSPISTSGEFESTKLHDERRLDNCGHRSNRKTSSWSTSTSRSRSGTDRPNRTEGRVVLCKCALSSNSIRIAVTGWVKVIPLMNAVEILELWLRKSKLSNTWDRCIRWWWIWEPLKRSLSWAVGAAWWRFELAIYVGHNVCLGWHNSKRRRLAVYIEQSPRMWVHWSACYIRSLR